MEKNIKTLEETIESLVRKNSTSTTVSFDYDHKRSQLHYKVSVFTENAKHGESFLLREATSNSFEDALEQIIAYIKDVNGIKENVYTVIWSKTGDNGSHVSYFSANSIFEALEKFIAGKKKSDYTIYEAKVSPIA